MYNTKLSIITINFNNLEGLKKTLTSVVNQTWQEFEYIIIDGGSTDGSVAYVESKSKQIDYWVSEPDKGIYNAMNKGIAKASGEYLLFLNSGDHLYDLEVLEKNIEFINEYDLVSFDLQIANNKTSQIFRFPEEIRFVDMYDGSFCSVLHPATFIKKELFNKVGLYDEKYKIVSDWKFFILALFKYNCSYKKINATLSCFYLGGISSGFENRIERDQVLNANFKSFVYDYEELIKKRNILNSNRFRMLIEIEKTIFGRKLVSLFFRSYIIVFLKNKLNTIIK
ncbi:glycosyltransferase [Flavobacterium sp. XN-5]|uniref:glycosyltransferase family 2 protein n=1 Tax=Flavobacterium sp. XN-5 TaxID=2599390 RepID=UPI0011CA6E7D|nr:glycosyltransferase family 2 protein [Flavobacterium sp. XN-5]NGY37447.1 glycosyltransferase [Flavobacterium sp. XN-5]